MNGSQRRCSDTDRETHTHTPQQVTGRLLTFIKIVMLKAKKKFFFFFNVFMFLVDRNLLRSPDKFASKNVSSNPIC